MDAPSIGNFFTWTNGRVKAKLDRVLIDPTWNYGNFNCCVDFKDFEWVLDHCPLVIKLFNHIETVNKPFKFFNMWLVHPKFKTIVNDVWRTVILGTEQYRFAIHLKALKSPLKLLNKEEYGHISEKASHANEEYKAFVQQFDVLTASKDDRNKLHMMRENAMFLTEAEKQFFNKKFQIKNLIKGDKGSKFFHDLIKKSHRDKSISCILDQSGQPTTSLLQVESLFVDHFKSLLGTTSPREHCNADIIRNGPSLSAAQ
ncbi:uncharacterized protein LOC116029728 [Ipomoea triloba]|uniref:uncharacterized protein LOC116029728 n=1 Tax=Ipomoea triloba TaxID=35885 RepID=UPI00125E2FA7|nr:uncharacterized protein LOC116029728 [Ipomoea triloba]